MKKIICLVIMMCGLTASAQIYDPVSWKTSVEKISETEYYLLATATIEPGWHLYSQKVPKGGPFPTSFDFEKSPTFELVGGVVEEKGKVLFDKVFELEIKFFEDMTTFKQRIKLTSGKKAEIDATVDFMVCDDTNCLPPTIEDISFSIK